MNSNAKPYTDVIDYTPCFISDDVFSDSKLLNLNQLCKSEPLNAGFEFDMCKLTFLASFDFTLILERVLNITYI